MQIFMVFLRDKNVARESRVQARDPMEAAGLDIDGMDLAPAKNPQQFVSGLFEGQAGTHHVAMLPGNFDHVDRRNTHLHDSVRHPRIGVQLGRVLELGCGLGGNLLDSLSFSALGRIAARLRRDLLG